MGFYSGLKKARWEDCGLLCKCYGPVEKEGDQHLNLSKQSGQELQAELSADAEVL